ncbi:MAG: hypothetical protein RLZZ86_279 [Cyanobacteriota bacterium]|jgi:LmbE family N-acetylglucosaminyl deacetylase
MMLLSDKKKILFIGAHTDDVELSCGGTIHKLIQAGHDVRVYVFSYVNDMTLLLEHQRSMLELGVDNYILNTYDTRTMSYYRQSLLSDLCVYRSSFQPDIIFTHDPADIHQDHSVVGQETLRAFKYTNILSYMHPWNGSFNPNYFVSLSKGNVDAKINACKQYDSQSHRAYMSEDMIKVNSTYYTNQAPYDHYCEAFKVYSIYD